VAKQKASKNKKKKKPWRWNPIHQQVFDNIKAAITKEVKPVKIDTGAYATQLGAVITQDSTGKLHFLAENYL
jgi:hypothetical protein